MTHIATSYTSLNKNIDKLSLKIKLSLYGRLREVLERIELSCDNALLAVSWTTNAKPCVVMAINTVKSTFLQ